VRQLSRLAWWSWPTSRVVGELGPAAAVSLADEGRNATVTDAAPARRFDMALARVRRGAARALRRVAHLFDPPPPADPAAAEVMPQLDPALLSMGRGSYFPPVVRGDPSSGHRATVGNYCSIAFGCEFVLDGSATPTPLSALALGLDPDERLDARLRGGDIVVGGDCWIAREARVLPGVTIGPGAVVAGYSVVTEDVRPYAVVGGNPARETARRFDDETVEALLDIAWWDWPEDLVKERYADLCSPDVASFVLRYGRGRVR
jgi:chloramphenicol O-acetyltransferase type B